MSMKMLRIALSSSARLSCYCAVVAAFCFFEQGLGMPGSNASLNNANHIFNAIHSSMRQWGSSLNHNGMSVFPAVVPKGTKLYHGTGLKDAVTGIEWVAFERNHAMNFAHLFLSPAPGRPDGVSLEKHPQSVIHRRQPPPVIDAPFWSFPGYLHAYEAKRDLNLLYLDGSAAAKTSKGTLDLSDVLLLNRSTMRESADLERAEWLCQMASQAWDGRVDGFIRMEAGFEIIVCSFENTLDLAQALRTESLWANDTLADPDGLLFHWLLAAANRYDGIGGSPSRVLLNYETFFTAYTYELGELLDGDTPRLRGAPRSILESMRREVDLIVRGPNAFRRIPEVYDWQAITDMIVQRYASPLKSLATSSRFERSSDALAKELNYLLRPFIDTSSRNKSIEIQRCVSEIVQSTQSSSSVAGRAVELVLVRICSTLSDASWALYPFLEGMESIEQQKESAHEQLGLIRDLVSWLKWPDWKKCKNCDWDEICSIPMFPFGYAEDHQTPRCRSQSDFAWPMDYWFDEYPA